MHCYVLLLEACNSNSNPTLSLEVVYIVVMYAEIIYESTLDK